MEKQLKQFGKMEHKGGTSEKGVNTENREGLEKERGGNCIQTKMIYYSDYEKVWICFPPNVERVQNFRPALGSQHKYFVGRQSRRRDLWIEKLTPGREACG